MAGTARILVMDGGGIFGALPATYLTALEELTGKPLADCFHLIAGTSSGGILACGLARPGSPVPAAELRRLWLEESEEIFKRSTWRKLPGVGGFSDLFMPKYSRTGLDGMLTKMLGDSWLSDVTACDLLIPAQRLDPPPGRTLAYFFKSAKARGVMLAVDESAPEKDFKLKDVAAATSAAPTYFPPVQITDRSGRQFAFADGALIRNHPIIAAIAEANLLYPEADRLEVVSMGTGNQPVTYSFQKAKGWGQIGWVGPVIESAMRGNTDASEYEAEAILMARPGNMFERFDMPIQDDPDYAFQPEKGVDKVWAENIHRLDLWSKEAVRRDLPRLEKLAEILRQPKTPREDLGYPLTKPSDLRHAKCQPAAAVPPKVARRPWPAGVPAP